MEYAVSIPLKKEVKGSELINYLEKAASDLGLNVEKEKIAGGNRCIDLHCYNPGNYFRLEFFAPLHFLYLYAGKMRAEIYEEPAYRDITFIPEVFASNKRVRILSEKIKSKLDDLIE